MPDWRDIIARFRELTPEPEPAERFTRPTKPRIAHKPPPRPPREKHERHTRELTCAREACSKKFSSKRQTVKFCSRRCQLVSLYERRRDATRRRRENKLATAREALPPGYYERRRERLTQQLAAVRPRGPGSIGKREVRFTLTCACGEQFASAYAGARWHSPTCRKRHQRMRVTSNGE